MPSNGPAPSHAGSLLRICDCGRYSSPEAWTVLGKRMCQRQQEALPCLSQGERGTRTLILQPFSHNSACADTNLVSTFVPLFQVKV